MKVVSSTDTRLISGSHIVYLKASEPRDLPAVFEKAVADHPDVTVSAGPVKQAKAEKGDVSLIEAVMSIVTEGDESELTQGGRPLVSAVRKRTGVSSVTSEDIDTALLELE